MNSARQEILLSASVLRFLEPQFARAFSVQRLWERTDPKDFAGTKVLVVGGPEPVTGKIIDSLPSLGLIACLTAGYDTVDVEHALRRGVAISHAPGASAADVADYALGLVIAMVRGIVSGDRTVRAGRWTAGPPFKSRSLADVRIGVVGLGKIGGGVAERCAALRMQVSWWGPSPKPAARWPRADSLQALARGSDVLVLCAASDHISAPLIGAAELDALGASGILVNVGRGSLVDEPRLIECLRTGRLGGAALDVFAAEPVDKSDWEDLANVILSPHIAGFTPRTLDGMVALAQANIEAFLAGRPLPNPIPEMRP